MSTVHVSSWVDQCGVQRSMGMHTLCKINDRVHTDVSHQVSNHVLEVMAERRDVYRVVSAVCSKCGAWRAV